MERTSREHPKLPERKDKNPRRAKRDYQTWRVDRLKPHAQQADLFGDVSKSALRELAADMKSNGLNHAVEILPDGTIIAGHQRVRAAKLLGWKTIKCWVRADLAAAGAAAVEERLIMDNIHRRQLSVLDRARTYRRLKELQHGDDYSAPDKVRGDLRDYIARQFGVSGRTLDRWERVLDTPKAIQDCVSSGLLSMDMAGKAAGLPGDVQEQIADRIKDGEIPQAVLAEFLDRKPSRPKRIGDALHQFVKELDRAHRELGGRIDRIESSLPDDVRRSIRKGQKLIRGLLSRDDANRERASNSAEHRPDASRSAESKAAATAKLKRRAR